MVITYPKVIFWSFMEKGIIISDPTLSSFSYFMRLPKVKVWLGKKSRRLMIQELHLKVKIVKIKAKYKSMKIDDCISGIIVDIPFTFKHVLILLYHNFSLLLSLVSWVEKKNKIYSLVWRCSSWYSVLLACVRSWIYS